MTAERANEILKRLEEEGRKRGLSRRFLDFYRRLLDVQARAGQRIGAVKSTLKKNRIIERQQAGQPLISFDELTLDWSLVQDTFSEVTAAFADYADLFGELPPSVRQSGSRPFLPRDLARAWFEQASLPATIPAADANEYLLLEAIIHATLNPFLAAHAKTLVVQVDQEQWRRGYCPVCGGRPDFAFLDSESSARWLLCSRCDTEWLFQRLECPYCLTQDTDALAYFTDDEGRYRLYICERCRKYIKAIDLRQSKSKLWLPLERLLTLEMDKEAQEMGYQPGHLEMPAGDTN